MKRKFFGSRKRQKRLRDFRRGIYILPNFFTTCSLFCGFYSIIASFNGNFTKAAWAVLLSAVFDWLDGKIARISHSISQFGMEYDSLSDLIAFGVAPGVMIYTWALTPFGRIGWLASFLYVACTALRLARFNVHSSTMEIRYFQGMPSPAAGGLIATTIIISHHLGWDETIKHLSILLLTFYLSFMMVSKIRYQSLKQELKGRIPFQILVTILCVLIIIVAEPYITLFVLFFLYAFSGPVLALKDKVVAMRKVALQKKEEVNV